MGLFWRIFFAFLITEFPVQLSRFRKYKKGWGGFVSKGGIFLILSILFTWPNIMSVSLWTHLAPILVFYILINLLQYGMYKLYPPFYTYILGPSFILNIVFIYFFSRGVMAVYFQGYNIVILFCFAVIAIWGVPAVVDYSNVILNKKDFPVDYNPGERYSKVSYIERAFLFLGIAKFGFFYSIANIHIPIWIFIPIAFLPRIFLKLNQDNVLIPWKKWLSTAGIAGGALLIVNLS